MSNEDTKACPACAEEIKAIAKKCKHCGEILDESLKQSVNIGGSQLDQETKTQIQKDLDGLSIHTGKLIGFTVATGGWLYLLLHMKEVSKKFNLVFKNTLSEKMVTTIIFLYGAFLLLFSSLFSLLEQASRSEMKDIINLMSITQVISIISSIILVIISFSARKGIENYAKETHNIDFKMNPIATFFFTFFYVNYSLNKLKNM